MLKYYDFVKKILIGPFWVGSMNVPRSLKTKWNKKNFKLGQKLFLSLKSYMTLLYLLIIHVVLSKFDTLTAT
jgi:hypothetical protein